MPDVQGEFERMIEATDRLLWSAYATSTAASHIGPAVQIRFPRKRKGGAPSAVRVSEQEARFILAAELARSRLLYSIETPTTRSYRFTGKSGLSGQTDLTIYSRSNEILWNIEFKAHGFTDNREKKFQTQKDIEKLLCEPAPGFWFHTLEGVDNSTLTDVWNGFVSDIRVVAKNIKDLKPKTLVFHACVLRQRFSVQRTLRIAPIPPDFGCVGVAGLVYSVTRKNLKSLTPKEGWKFLQAGEQVSSPSPHQSDAFD